MLLTPVNQSHRPGPTSVTSPYESIPSPQISQCPVPPWHAPVNQSHRLDPANVVCLRESIPSRFFTSRSVLVRSSTNLIFVLWSFSFATLITARRVKRLWKQTIMGLGRPDSALPVRWAFSIADSTANLSARMRSTFSLHTSPWDSLTPKILILYPLEYLSRSSTCNCRFTIAVDMVCSSRDCAFNSCCMTLIVFLAVVTRSDSKSRDWVISLISDEFFMTFGSRSVSRFSNAVWFASTWLSFWATSSSADLLLVRLLRTKSWKSLSDDDDID